MRFIKILRFLIPLIFLACQYGHASSVLTYQGRIVKPDGTTLKSKDVTLTVLIKSPGAENCLMFQETHLVDMSLTDGAFSVNIGAGTRVSNSIDGGLPLAQIFSNKSQSLGPFPSCDFGSTYTPNTVDVRKLIISFNDGTGSQTLQSQNINFVPFAIEATQVGGYAADSLLKVQGGSAPPLSPTDFTQLMDLIQGTSANYGKVSAVTAGTGLNVNGTAGATIQSSGTLNLTNTGVAAGSYGGATSAAQITVDAQGRITSASSIPISGFAGDLVGDVSGTQGATVVDLVGGVTAPNVASGANAANAASTTNVADTIVKRDANGDFTAGTITANLTGNATTSTNFLGSLGGDVSGTQGGTSVDKIKGEPVAFTGIAAGNFLKYNGTDWINKNINAADLKSNVNGLTQFPFNCTTTQTLIYNAITDQFDCGTITGTAPGGSASGDLSGSYPNPSVATVGGVSAANVASGANLANAATNTNVADTIVKRDASGNFTAGTITANLSGNATTATTAVNFIGSIAGDVSGTQGATSVDKIKGQPLAYTGITAGNFLKYDGTSWVNQNTNAVDLKSTVNGLAQFPLNCTTTQTITYNAVNDQFECANITLVSTTSVLNGDVTGPVGSNSVIAIQGQPVSVTAPLVNQSLIWDGIQWLPQALTVDMIPNHDTAKLTSGTLPIARGGTNSSTALNNNRIMASSGGAIVEAAAITANRALVSDVNGIPTQSAVSSTELGYVSGVTSAIQTQLNSKQATGNYVTGLTGDVSANGPGSVNATVNSVGGQTAANIAAGVAAANSSTSANWGNYIVRRDASGNFSAGTITATLNGWAANVYGVVSVGNGGTSASDPASARANLGIGNVGTANFNGSQAYSLRGDGSWQPVASVPSGTLCGLSGGGYENLCQGYYPSSSCPPGYSPVGIYLGQTQCGCTWCGASVYSCMKN